MSVAFRRESDEAHLEPRFELPIPSGPNLVTERGLRLIEERVVALEAAVKDAPDDETRNAIARDLRYWNTRRVTAELTPPAPGNAVGFGRSVLVRMNGRDRRLTIVGHDEADAATNRIAFTSPLAHALIGAVQGDLIDFKGGSDPIEVLEIPDGEYSAQRIGSLSEPVDGCRAF